MKPVGTPSARHCPTCVPSALPVKFAAANFTGNADGTQVGQCLADGVPTGFTQPNTQIRITVGGNPNVQPEESESFNFGVVWQPSGVQGLNMFADYYDIEITNLISSIGAPIELIKLVISIS